MSWKKRKRKKEVLQVHNYGVMNKQQRMSCHGSVRIDKYILHIAQTRTTPSMAVNIFQTLNSCD